jgi:hypothetical protein
MAIAALSRTGRILTLHLQPGRTSSLGQDPSSRLTP